MKNIITFITLLVTVLTYSQDKYTTYTSLYFNKDFKIDISKEKNNTISFWIDAYSMDKLSKKSSIKLKQKSIPNFIGLLEKAKEKYIEWTKVAKENNVDKLNKNVEYNSEKYTSAFLYGKWKFDYNVKLKARYLILENKYLMIIENMYPLKASDNQYIDSKGFAIVFENEKEFDDFIAKINIEKAKEKILSQGKKEDLFK